MSPQDTFLQLYDANADALFRYCYFRVYNRERARELMQEAFMKCWEVLARQNRDIENLRAFLYKIAKNLIIDEARKNKRRPTSSLEDLQEKGFDPGEDPTGAMKTALDNQELLVALEKLDPKYRDAVWLRYLHDMSVQEIAEILNDNANNVSVKIHRGLKQLRNLLEPN